MSRLTPQNVIKVAAVCLLFPFLAFLLLIVGIRAKDRKVTLEGAVYAAVFFLMLAVPQDNALSTVVAFLGLGSMSASVVRSYMLRDLWLPSRGRQPQHVASVAPQRPPHLATQPSRAASFAQSSDDLSSALAWVTSHAKQNKHRLSAESYVTILETCQALDAVIDAERRQPSADARFEYELEAMVREYLPTVLRGYLAIPPSMVDSRQPNGRTPNEELVEQLDLLSGQAEALHASRHSHTSAKLSSTGNFLRERFGYHQRDGFDFGIR